MTGIEEAPTYRYEAADWIIGRSPWAKQIVARVVDLCADDWLDQLAEAFADLEDGNRAWTSYVEAHPEPRVTGDDMTDEAKYAAWESDAPTRTPGARALGVMSSGELNLARLIGTLGGRVPLSINDISFDPRGAAVLADWLAVVRAQLPTEFYLVGGPS